MSTYLEAQRHRSAKKKLGIAVTDIRPGFIATPMTEGASGMFWVASVEKAVEQMYKAILSRAGGGVCSPSMAFGRLGAEGVATVVAAFGLMVLTYF